jgi:DinB superfamily
MTIADTATQSQTQDATYTLRPEELRALTTEAIDLALKLLRGCRDEDITFIPNDPHAHDDAAGEGEASIAWTLGHIIAHMTASSEEHTAIAAELARGVEYHGRSRYEVPWRTITTVAQCRARLEESRRMRLASLGAWPDQPQLENIHLAWENGPLYGPIQHMLLGLRHDAAHLEQVRDVVQQAREYRQGRRGRRSRF